MQNKIDKILAIPDIGIRIAQLKNSRGRYKTPEHAANIKNWDPQRHDIMNPEIYKDDRILVEKGKSVYDARTKKTIKTDDVYEEVKVNRIPLPIEQDIINIHTAFTVGTEPTLTCETEDDGEKNLLRALKYTFKKNHIKWINRQEVRSYLSEQEVAEYWYATTDSDGFWEKVWRKIRQAVTGRTPVFRPKCAVWSPFRGDELFPFMENDVMTGFMRGYKQTGENDTEIQCYMCVTDTTVYTWKMIGGTWTEESFLHGFSKMPINYMWRSEQLTRNISPVRHRIEKLLSQYGDCIDYHFFPYLVHFGEATNVQGKKRNHSIEVTGQNAKAPMYLTWDQVPDTVKFELTTELDLVYSMTNTPRISLDQLKSMAAVSGVAFKFFFMGAHMAVENHSEDVGPFMQRRVSIVSAILGDMNAALYKPSRSADIETEIVPYMIDSISDNVNTAVRATGGPIWDKATGIAFVGNIDRVDEVLEKLKEEQKEDASSGSEGSRETGGGQQE